MVIAKFKLPSMFKQAGPKGYLRQGSGMDASVLGEDPYSMGSRLPMAVTEVLARKTHTHTSRWYPHHQAPLPVRKEPRPSAVREEGSVDPKAAKLGNKDSSTSDQKDVHGHGMGEVCGLLSLHGENKKGPKGVAVVKAPKS